MNAGGTWRTALPKKERRKINKQLQAVAVPVAQFVEREKKKMYALKAKLHGLEFSFRIHHFSPQTISYDDR